MSRYLILLIPLLVFTTGFTWAQESSANTMSFDEQAGSPKASLSDVEWIQGHWRGEAFGGIVEELWSPPLGGSMMASFKLVVDGKVVFYEIETIIEENGTLILRLKHFHANLHGWEEKDETVDFKLVKLTPNKVFFDGFTLERVTEDEMNMYVVVDEAGSKSEVKFNYHRVK